MKKYVAYLAALAIIILNLYGCSGTDSNSVTSMNDDSVKTASVTIKADFGQDGLSTAFLNDIDNITIEYSAGCTGTKNLFEYYYVDNNSYLLNDNDTTPIFLAQFFESLYDLYVKTKLAELDNTTPINEYYNASFDWPILQSIPTNCLTTGVVYLTPDNSSVRLQLPTGYAGFKATLRVSGRDTSVDKVGSAGTLIEGENNIVIASLRGTWTLSKPDGSTLTPQITDAVSAGVVSLDKIHLSRNLSNMRIDLNDILANILYDNIYEDPSYYANMNEYYTSIAQTYAGTNIYKTNYPPFRTGYYGGIYEVTFDNGIGATVIPVPALFNIAQGFTGGTADNATWNGFHQHDALELELPKGKQYIAFILGYKLNIDGDNVSSLTMEPATTVSGDTMTGWILEAIIGGKNANCYLKTDAGWVTLNSCEPLDNVTIGSASIKDTLVKAFSSQLSAAALYPEATGCLDNLTDSWTDLDYYNALCNNNGTVYWPNYDQFGDPICTQGSLIVDAYIKSEVTETIEKACMQKFTGTRQSDFDLSDLFSNVIVNININ